MAKKVFTPFILWSILRSVEATTRKIHGGTSDEQTSYD